MLGQQRFGAGAGRGVPADDIAKLAPALLKNAIERLEEVIDQETAALQRRTSVDLNEFNDRKSHGLVEITRAMRFFEATPPEPHLVTALTNLRSKLEVNRAVLATHLEAVREVSTAIADAMQNADSDGTYAPVLKGGGRAS